MPFFNVPLSYRCLSFPPLHFKRRLNDLWIPDFPGKTAASGLPSMQSKQRKRSGESWMLISGYEGGEKTECNAKGKTLVNYN